MQRRRIGSLEVSLVGLGCNNFGRRIDERQTAEVVAAALDSGITFFDTADMYGVGRNEELLAEVLRTRRSEVVLATKFGNVRAPTGELLGIDGRPEYVAAACDASLARLRVARHAL